MPEGLSRYVREFDIKGSAEEKSFRAGLAADVVEGGEVGEIIGGVPLELIVDLASGTIGKVKPSQRRVRFEATTYDNIKQCAAKDEIPEKVPRVEPGQRGCSCNAVGQGLWASSRLFSLLWGKYF